MELYGHARGHAAKSCRVFQYLCRDCCQTSLFKSDGADLCHEQGDASARARPSEPCHGQGMRLRKRTLVSAGSCTDTRVDTQPNNVVYFKVFAAIVARPCCSRAPAPTCATNKATPPRGCALQNLA